MFTFGSSNMPVVTVAEDAAEPVQFAAAELRRYLALILGAPVLFEANEKTPRIDISVTEDVDLGDEGYELICESGGFRLVGGGPAGVVYGAYEFLRRYGGCQFSGYAPDGEYVPRRERIEIPADTVRMKPNLWYRGLQFSRLTDRELMIKRLDWMAKNGMNHVMLRLFQDLPVFGDSTVADPQTGIIMDNAKNRFTSTFFREHLLPEVKKRGLKIDMNHHNLVFWLPPERYYDTHPEWYAMVEGVRLRNAGQLAVCTSNRQAVGTMIENIRVYLRENPEVGIVGVIPEDGLGMCQCAECRKLDMNPTDADRLPLHGRRLRSPEGENQSKTRRYALLLNEVSRAIRDEFPNVKLGGAAYVDLMWPPRDVTLESNIVIWVAIYWRCGAHELGPNSCEVNRFFWDILDQWRRSQPCEIILYEYYMGMSCQRGLPYPLAGVITREWSRLRSLGIGGATVQSREWDHNVYALNYVAFASCGWQICVNAATLLDDFLLGMFGSLADVVRPVYETFERQVRVLEEKGSDSPFVRYPWGPGLLPDARNIAFLLDPLDVPTVIARIEEAMRKTGDKRERLQAAAFLHALRYWQMSAELFRTAQAIAEAEQRGDLENANRLAQQAFDQNEPVLKQIELSPQSGWIRDPSATWRDKNGRFFMNVLHNNGRDGSLTIEMLKDGQFVFTSIRYFNAALSCL